MEILQMHYKIIVVSAVVILICKLKFCKKLKFFLKFKKIIEQQISNESSFLKIDYQKLSLVVLWIV